MSAGYAVTFVIDADNLTGYTDEHVASLWHIAQANPAPHGDRDAGELARAIGAEITRRWLASVPAPLYHHQAADHYWQTLGRHGHWEDRGTRWVHGDPSLPGGPSETPPVPKNLGSAP